jgi:hypothetical protein
MDAVAEGVAEAVHRNWAPCRDPAPDLRYDRSAEDVPEIFVGLWTGWAPPHQRPDGRRSLLAGRGRGGAGHHHLVAAAAAAGDRAPPGHGPRCLQHRAMRHRSGRHIGQDQPDGR